jgi:hypothetical protein
MRIPHHQRTVVRVPVPVRRQDRVLAEEPPRLRVEVPRAGEDQPRGVLGVPGERMRRELGRHHQRVAERVSGHVLVAPHVVGQHLFRHARPGVVDGDELPVQVGGLPALQGVEASKVMGSSSPSARSGQNPVRA